MIYFIQAHESGDIKIGFTKSFSSFERRLKTLQTGNSQRLDPICLMHGTWAQEQALHRKFSALRLQGEWFQQDDGLTEFIAEHATLILPPAENHTDLTEDRERFTFVSDRERTIEVTDENWHQLWMEKLKETIGVGK